MIELGIQVQHLEQVVSVDFVQVAVSQRSHVATRLAYGSVLARVFAEYVVLAWNKNDHVIVVRSNCVILNPPPLPVGSLNIAITTLSFSISMEPRDMKYNEVSTSPWCTRVSPGGACVVRNFNDRALKHTHCHVGIYPVLRYSGHSLLLIPQTAGRCAVKGRTVLQQIPVEVQTNISL